MEACLPLRKGVDLRRAGNACCMGTHCIRGRKKRLRLALAVVGAMAFVCL